MAKPAFKITVREIKGADEIIRKMRMISGRTADRELERALMAGAFVLESEIKINIVSMGAVDTGTLLGSVHVSRDRSLSSRDKVVVKVGPATDYAVYVEFGTFRMAARPYVRKAWDEHRDTAIQEIADHLQRELENIT